jgi:glycosyltransferase involved in cell wall biosynthesis
MLGVIIPAHNEEKNIEKVIDNVLACGVEPIHIFVIDNNSTDRTKILSEKKM